MRDWVCGRSDEQMQFERGKKMGSNGLMRELQRLRHGGSRKKEQAKGL